MPSIHRLLMALLIPTLLLAACNLPRSTEEVAPTMETPAVLASSAVPSLMPTSPQPTLSPVEPTPLAPSDTPVPEPAIPSLVHLAVGSELVISELEMIDPLSGWAVGGLADDANHVLTTSDGGAAWRDVTPPQPGETSTLSAASFFLDASTAWVTYSSLDTQLPDLPVVWRTSDAGQTWQASQPLDLTDLSQSYATDLYFVDAAHGWLLTHVGVGMSHDYVTLFRTTDGGNTWARILDPYNDGQIQACQKTGLLFVDSQVGWLTGDCGGVMAGALLSRTVDGGLTWTYIDLPAPADNPLLFEVNTPAACGTYEIHFLDPQSAVLAVRCTLYDPASSEPGYAHYLYTTQDGGITWSSQPYPGGTLLFVSMQNGWALANDIYQTIDGGASWTLVNQVHWLARFDFISPQLGWAASYTETEQALVQTTNGGAHWSMLEPIIIP